MTILKKAYEKMAEASKGERERFVQQYIKSQRQSLLDIRDKLLTGGFGVTLRNPGL